MNKHQAARMLAKFFLRSSRGQGLIDRLLNPIKDILNGAVYLFAIKGLTGFTIPYYWIPVIVICIKIIEPLIAYLDEYWGFWKAEAYYNSYDLNLVNQEIINRLKNIEEKLK